MLIALPELVNRARIASKILPAAHKDDRDVTTEMMDLREPLYLLSHQRDPPTFKFVAHLLPDIIE
jgi:hypothetical protein